jgi:membrane fusion protein, multidrug efflux system
MNKLKDTIRQHKLPVAIASVVLVLCVGLLVLSRLAASRTNREPLTSTPKGVTVVQSVTADFREQRRYIGTFEPWQEANVGPQLVAAYVDTVLVRPGAIVKKGDVLATLDCRQTSSSSSAIAAQARALEARQKAVSGETARVQGLAEGGFVSENEVDQRVAQSAAGDAQIEALRAQLSSKVLEVGDCVLRAPFAGEVSTRLVDSGAFARPGSTLLTVVDRSVVRLSGFAPETDFVAVAPGTKVEIEMFATGQRMTGVITRRAPQADARSRNVRFEIDLKNDDRTIPTGTTAAIHITSPVSQPATEIPLTAATVRGTKATVFVIEEGDVAVTKSFKIVGERAASLFLEQALESGTRVVVEGRSKLANKDKVVIKTEPFKGQTARLLEPKSPSSLPTSGMAQ